MKGLKWRIGTAIKDWAERYGYKWLVGVGYRLRGYVVSDDNTNSNIDLWKSVENTNTDYMKKVKYPFPHLSIDAQYQILTATTLWGPYGDKWGVKNEHFLPIPLDTENRVSIIYTATLFYPNGELPINADIFLYVLASGKYKTNNDYAKKVSTDAFTKGLSKLGFSADVFMGKFDGGKYDGVEAFTVELEPKPPASDEQRKTLLDYMNSFESAGKIKWADAISDYLDAPLTKEQAEGHIKRAKELQEQLQ